jgi:hypothetical protein
VFLVCEFGGSGSSNELQMFDSTGGFLGTHVVPDLFQSYSSFESDVVEFDGDSIRVRVGYWAPEDCHACGPSIFKVLRLDWDGTAQRFRSVIEDGDFVSSDPSGESARGSARIEIRVNDCERCVITAYGRMVDGEALTWEAPPVQDGTTTLEVPRVETPSMSFDVRGGEGRPFLGYFNAIPTIALAGRGSGANLEANWCWQGATADVTTLTVRHRTVPVPEEDQDISNSDTAHIFSADPALPVVDGQCQQKTDGGVGHQDGPYCVAAGN